jgi:hypothetical protein
VGSGAKVRGLARSARLSDLRDFPEYAEQLFSNRPLAALKTHAWNGPIAYRLCRSRADNPTTSRPFHLREAGLFAEVEDL